MTQTSGCTLAELRRYYEAGYSFREISTMTGVPYGTLLYRAHRIGLAVRKRGQPVDMDRLPPEAYHEVARLYVDEGLTSGEIGEQLGLHPNTVLSRLKRAGIPRRSKHDSLKLRWTRKPHEKPRPPQSPNAKAAILGGRMDNVDQSIALAFLENDHGLARTSSLLNNHPLREELMLRDRCLLAEFDTGVKVVIREDGGIIPLRGSNK